MAILNQQQVQPMLQAYMSDGKPAHFIQSDEKYINGYIFKRSELLALLSSSAPNHLYIMLGLVTDANPNIGTYITPIIGKIVNGKIEPNQLVLPQGPNSSPVYISSAQVKPMNPIEGGAGYPITVVDAQRMVDYHLVSHQPLSLVNSGGLKIRAFNLNDEDVSFLLANDNNKNLIVMPALRDQDQTGASIAHKHLTFIFAWLSGNQVHTISLYDYTEPCPPQCATF
ncbi:MAG: hypothetical protein R3279_01155 [Putridiphycobacter sp.]|nr:hypothetical protein [Putridiphycobacter sp.]